MALHMYKAAKTLLYLYLAQNIAIQFYMKTSK